MKKIIVSFLLGAALTVSSSAFASSNSLIGKQIQNIFSVVLDGKKLENGAIIIDGTSYLPVREIAEKLNLDVDFSSEEGIRLTSKKDIQTPEIVEVDSIQNGGEPVQEILGLLTLDEINAKIKNDEEVLSQTQLMIEHYQSMMSDTNVPAKEMQSWIDFYQNIKEETLKRILELNKQKSELESQQTSK